MLQLKEEKLELKKEKDISCILWHMHIRIFLFILSMSLK